jgi:serine/threonine protein kinase
MKFGKELVRSVEEHNPAWKKYAVDYKGMKKTLPKNQPEADDAPDPAKSEGSGDYSAFWEVFERSQNGLDHFYRHKESWAQIKHATLQNDVDHLRDSVNLATSVTSIQEMKEHLIEFRDEVELVREFLQVNQTAFGKILKKYDKRTFSSVRTTKLASVMETHIYLDGATMDEYLRNIDGMISQLDELMTQRSPKAGQKRRFNERGVATTILEEKARQILEEIEEQSPFFAKNPARVLPSFSRNEIEAADELLGQGKYCSVYEIASLHFKEGEIDEARLMLQQSCLEQSEGSPRYAIKQINDHLTTASKVDGAVDLAIEAKFLSCISHPNIINMVATPTSSSTYFLVLDRVYGSLDDKIIKEWHPEVTKLKGKFGLGKLSHKKGLASLWQTRLRALHDVGKGMVYLHENNIIHRDIKPHNIGIDIHGNANIFDFGLVKELLAKDQVGADNQFRATGRTGTRKVRCLFCSLLISYVSYV